jgi:hypothetical protein
MLPCYDACNNCLVFLFAIYRSSSVNTIKIIDTLFILTST